VSKSKEFINNFLSHYASEYYDPAKAREYYLRTRELKGRRSGSNLKTEKKKQAWAYAKDKITTEKEELLKETGNEFRQDFQILRTEASTKRKQLSEKLSLLLQKATEIRKSDADKISENQKRESERISRGLKNRLNRVSRNAQKELERLSEMQTKKSEQIAKEASRKIAALPSIPKGVSAEKRAELAAERSEEIAKIRGTATKEQKSLSDAIKTERGAVTTKAKVERDTLTKEANAKKEALSKETESKREALSKWSTADKTKHRQRVGSEKEAVSSELKATLERGRAGYEEAKVRIKAKYEEKLDAEYEAIRRNV
jgi:hypothetical protein